MKITLGTITVFALLAAASSVQAANEVKTIEVATTVQTYSGSGYSTFRSHFEVLLANLGANKQANIRARLADGTWTDIPLYFNRTANNNQEVWSVDVYDYNTASRFGSNVQFAVNYTVNGTTYWDNNNSANYNVPVNAGWVLLNGLNVYSQPVLSSAYVYGNQYNGAVTLRNIAPVKDVKVVYSTDNWATVKTASASYNANYYTSNYINLANPTPSGFEEWTFALDVGTTNTQLVYAISYTANGQTYWDNNFGQNYSVAIYHNYR